MAQALFEQEMLIAAPYARVQEHLIKLMTDITEIHPFVTWTRHVKTTTAADGGKVEHYLVHDRMKLGPFPLEFTYNVDVQITTTGKMVFNAYQTPGIHLYNQTWCEPTETGTRVCERIEITAPRWLLKTTYQGAVSAHKELFARLKAKIEQATRTSGDLAGAEHPAEDMPGG